MSTPIDAEAKAAVKRQARQGRSEGPEATAERHARTASPRRGPRARRSGRRSASSSSWVPRSATSPRSRTTIWSASRTVERRWAMTIVVRPSASFSSASPTARSVGHVERRGRLVEHEHGRVAQDRAGDRDALLLAAGEAEAALADDGVVAVGQRGDRVVDLGGAGGVLDLVVGRVRPREAQVLAHRGVEQVGLLRDDADRVGQRVEGQLAQVDAVDRAPRPARGRTAARRGSPSDVLPAPVSPTSAVRVPGGDGDVDVAQRPLVAVAEPDAVEAHLAAHVAPASRVAGLDVDRQVEVLEDAVEQRDRGLDVHRHATAATGPGRTAASAAW